MFNCKNTLLRVYNIFSVLYYWPLSYRKWYIWPFRQLISVIEYYKWFNFVKFYYRNHFLSFFPSFHLVGGVEKWKDEKLWEDGKVGEWKIFRFPSCVFGWRGGKVGGRKTLLFGWKEKWEDRKGSLYKLTIIPLLHNW